MVNKMDCLKANNSLLHALDKYTEDQIEEIASSYYYYRYDYVSKIKIKSLFEVYNIYNEIMRIIVKNNLKSIYFNNFAQNLENFVLRVDYDELEPFYDELSESSKKMNKRLTKYIHAKFLKHEFPPLALMIRTNRLLRKVLSSSTNDIFYEFNEAFSLFKKMGMNNKEMIDATLCIVSCNIYNGIYVDSLTSMEVEEIKRAHRLIEDAYLSKMETKEEYDVDSLVLAFSLLGYPNPSAVSSVLERIDRKRTIEEETPKVVIEPVKVELKPMISKSDYHEGMQIINKYYNLDTGEFTKILKMSEIQYVVSIMQSLKFSSETIESFISKALKKHKSIDSLDRYLDLSQKIDYYKEEKDIAQLDKTLHELVDEYNKSSIDDKEFWLTSINEELKELEILLNKSHSYELGIRKSQE